MKRLLALALLLALLPFAALAQGSPLPQGEALYHLALQLTEHVKAGEEAQALAMMDGAMVQALTGQVEGMWATLTMLAGDFLEAGA